MTLIGYDGLRIICDKHGLIAQIIVTTMDGKELKTCPKCLKEALLAQSERD